MDDLRLGVALRAIRVRRGIRQADVGAASGVSQQVVSAIERGRLEHVGLATARRVAAALDVTLQMQARWRDGDVNRLLDEGHAVVVETAVATLRRKGWETLVEFSFSHYGERGSVDVVGWHPARSALILIEAKSRILDLQDLLATLDRKTRLVPRLLAEDRGWRAQHVARVVVVPRTTAARTLVDRHPAVFDAALPGRNAEVRSWLRSPRGPLAALWFVSPTLVRSGTQRRCGRGRVRIRTGAPRGPDPCGAGRPIRPGAPPGRPPGCAEPCVTLPRGVADQETVSQTT